MGAHLSIVGARAPTKVYKLTPMHTCQLPNIPRSGLATQVFSKLQEKCVVPTRSSGSDLTAKHFGGSDPTYQVFARLAQVFLICNMVVMCVGAGASPFLNPL